MLPTDAEMHNTNTEGKIFIQLFKYLTPRNISRHLEGTSVFFFLIQHHTIAAHKAVEAQYIAVILN